MKQPDPLWKAILIVGGLLTLEVILLFLILR